MKPPPITEASSESPPFLPGSLDTKPLNQSLFSLLLEIESQLRAEARQDSLLRARQLAAAKRKFKPPLG
jgi:hypothetical protein